MKTAACVLGGWLLLASAGVAGPADFRTCDGYGPPSGKSDGMTTTPGSMGSTRATDIRRSEKIPLGEQGALACDRALREPALLDTHWLRRASLLQAKAVHQLAAGQAQPALETLAAADAAGASRGSAAFAQSLGLGNRAVRAFALTRLGRKEQALAQLQQLDAARPYALSIRMLGQRLRLLLDDSLDARLASLHALVDVNPNVSLLMFWMQIEQGRFADAIATARDVSFDMPSSRRGWVLENSRGSEYTGILARTDFTGALAYALQATGDVARSDEQMQRAVRELEDATVPPEGQDGKPPPERTMKEFEQRRTQAESAKRQLNTWTTMILMRSMAQRSKPDDIVPRISADKSLAGLPVVPDVLQQIQLAPGRDRQQRDDLVADLRANYLANDRRGRAVSPDDLMSLLPRAESDAALPKFRRSGDGHFFSDNGFSFEKDADSDAQTVRFTHSTATQAVVEELAMLSAATRARQQGKDRLLLLTRRTIERTTHLTTVYGYAGGTTRDIPSGNEAQLQVLFLDSGNIPDAYRQSASRLLSVDAVIAALGDKYAAAR
jgi:hypothetical protein